MAYTPHFPLEPVPARPFTPVPVRPRHDGWTPDRQAAFIEALAACGCVGDAAARVGMSTPSAYALRLREGAAPFRAAWDAALGCAVRLLSEAAFSRALHGVAVPHFYKGEKVGEHRRFNEGLTRFLLRHLDPRTYAPDPGVTMYNLDEKKIARMAGAVREVLTAGTAADVATSPVDDSGAAGEMIAKLATSAASDQPERDDLDIRHKETAVPGDVSLTSLSYERWGEASDPADAVTSTDQAQPKQGRIGDCHPRAGEYPYTPRGHASTSPPVSRDDDRGWASRL